MITFESRSKISVNNGSLDEIDIQIMDAETNLPVNFNNQNWTMTLILHITRELSTKLLPLESIPLAKTDGNKADVPPPPKVVTQDQLDLKLLES
jgi:hypothetical protein